MTACLRDTASFSSTTSFSLPRPMLTVSAVRR